MPGSAKHNRLTRRGDVSQNRGVICVGDDDIARRMQLFQVLDPGLELGWIDACCYENTLHIKSPFGTFYVLRITYYV